MECPHLEQAVKLTKAQLKNDHIEGKWPCTVCKTEVSPWLCLYCGIVHCGRYVNQHGLLHYESNEDHCVCMDCDNFSTYCYRCDDFVVNDTEDNRLDQARSNLNKNQLSDSLSHSSKLHSIKRKKSEGDENDDRTGPKNKSKAAKSNKKARVSGLRNLGNTCFMNAVLQSLSNIQQFSGYFKLLPSLDSPPAKNGRKVQQTRNNDVDTVLLAEELRKILILLWQSGKGAISPQSLFTVIWKVVPRFRGYQQQDAHEFLRYMLDRLHTELLSLLPVASNDATTSQYMSSLRSRSTIVTAIFGGILQSEVNCLVCDTESKKHDPFLDLSLDMPSHIINKSNKQKENQNNDVLTTCTLYDCLSSFTELEKLSDTEQYFCNNCKERQQSTKKFWIRRLPNVLCLHLKRFRWSNYFRTKLDNYVEFPITGLDMTNYLLTHTYGTRGSGTGSSMYDLAAVIVHHGSGAGSGHYTAYATYENNWHHFNDSSVTVCDEETVRTCNAYILFYIKREVKLPSSVLT